MATAFSLAAFLWACYSTGFRFGWSFDDEINLAGLGQVADLSSALQFVFEGHAGPLGRPLALLSFVLQRDSWPSEPADFLRVNTLIHLLNTALVGALALRLHPHAGLRGVTPAWFALTVAALWGMSPLLQSSSLMAVQRMNTLSALFALGALLAYVAGRELYSRRVVLGLLVMSAAIGLGTLLAVGCKENGALLPLLALCTEFCLLRGSGLPFRQPPGWWVGLFMILPTLLVLLYLSRYLLGDGVYPGRDFTLEQRLLTEPRVLWEYLRLVLVPVRSAIGPLREVPVSSALLTPVGTLVALLAWAALLALLALARGRLWRVLRFGVLWFLCGHLLESTVVGLEIYFEHRNYLPAAGLCLAAVALLTDHAVRPLVRVPLLAALLLNQALVLRESSTLWQSPLLAGALWSRNNPGSLRALQLYAWELGNRGKLDEVRTLLRDVPSSLGKTLEFQLYALDVSCELEDEASIRRRIAAVNERLARGADAATVTQLLLKLQDRVDRDTCPGLRLADVEAMLELVVREGSGAQGGARGGAHYLLAKIAMRRGDFSGTMSNLEKGFALSPQLAVAVTMIQVLQSAGNDEQADELIGELEKAAPRRPFVHGHWIKTLDSLRRG